MLRGGLSELLHMRRWRLLRLHGPGIMSWRAGPRETVKPGDPLAHDPHPLTLAHRERFEEEVREKFGRLFGLNP